METKEIREALLLSVVYEVMDYIGKPRHELQSFKIKRISAGRYNWIKNTIVLPEWILNEHDKYQIHYTIHEALHFKHHKHDDSMKLDEMLLCSLYGMERIDYAKAYPVRIYSNGQKIYEKKRI